LGTMQTRGDNAGDLGGYSGCVLGFSLLDFLMKKYRVQSGGMDVIVKANSFDKAVEGAIAENLPDSLGILISALEVGKGEGETLYISTEKILQKLGRWGEK